MERTGGRGTVGLRRSFFVYDSAGFIGFLNLVFLCFFFFGKNDLKRNGRVCLFWGSS